MAASRRLAAELFARAGLADEESVVSSEAIDALHASGLALAPFPHRHGGAGLIDDDQGKRLVDVLRQVGAGDLSVARIYEGHVNAVGLLLRYGSEDQVADFAEQVRKGALSGVWNAEGRLPLTARKAPDGWRLSGEKILASGIGIVTHPIITPRTDDGVIMLLAESEPEGTDLSAWTPHGMRASATGTAHWSRVVLPQQAMVGQAGDYLRQPVFSGGAWRFCAVHLGAAERLLDLFRAHLKRRGRDGDPYQRQRIASATAACVTARLWIERAASLLAGDGGEPDGTVAFVNLTRMVTERACLDVLEAVQRGLGLGAFMRPDPIERIARDLATYLRQPVPDAAMADAASAVLAAETPTFDLWGA